MKKEAKIIIAGTITIAGIATLMSIFAMRSQANTIHDYYESAMMRKINDEIDKQRKQNQKNVAFLMRYAIASGGNTETVDNTDRIQELKRGQHALDSLNVERNNLKENLDFIRQHSR